jgi:hypothetical protein
MPERNSDLKANLTAALYEIYFNLQSVGLIPPPVTLALQYKADRDWKRLLKNVGILLGAGMLAGFVYGAIMLFYK